MADNSDALQQLSQDLKDSRKENAQAPVAEKQNKNAPAPVGEEQPKK